MQSKVTTVSEYMAEAPPERQAALARLRDLCRDNLPGYDESMMYGMPGYIRNGDVNGGVGFASQKHHISVYFTQEIATTIGKPQLEGRRGVSIGKSCIRFSKPEHIDFGVIEEMVKASDHP